MIDKYRIDHLYVARSSCGWLKIGRSHNVEVRLRNIETSAPPPLTVELVAVWPGLGRYEASVHRLLQPYRGRGEWFSSAAESLVAVLIERGVRETVLAELGIEDIVRPPRKLPRAFGRRIYARGNRLWCRVRVSNRWAAKPTPFNVGQEDDAMRWTAEAQRALDGGATIRVTRVLHPNDSPSEIEGSGGGFRIPVEGSDDAPSVENDSAAANPREPVRTSPVANDATGTCDRRDRSR